MDGETILLIMLALIAFGLVVENRSKCKVKDKTSTKKPDIQPAPQSPKKNKFGRTPDEQALHEWMEDNPR
jgi:hypothetical protein